MDWQEQLISLYLWVCKQYEQRLCVCCVRMSNHTDLSFTDEEAITLYLFGIMNKNRAIKDIYVNTVRFLSDWFPRLPSYEAWVQRLNRIHEAFAVLCEAVSEQWFMPEEGKTGSLMDSMPIVLAQNGRRFQAKVAPEIATANGYCPAKKMHYYGVKLHILACYGKGSLPVPDYVGLTSAGMADRKAYELILPYLSQASVFADKAYQVRNESILVEEQVKLHTPVKKQKGQAYLEASDQLLSTAISKIRQPIESFFNWIEEKTGIQMASKVRSCAGLMVHVFGRLAAAFYLLATEYKKIKLCA